MRLGIFLNSNGFVPFEVIMWAEDYLKASVDNEYRNANDDDYNWLASVIDDLDEWSFDDEDAAIAHYTDKIKREIDKRYN